MIVNKYGLTDPALLRMARVTTPPTLIDWTRTRSPQALKPLPSATVCVFPTTLKTWSASLRSMTPSMRGAGWTSLLGRAGNKRFHMFIFERLPVI